MSPIMRDYSNKEKENKIIEIFEYLYNKFILNYIIILWVLSNLIFYFIINLILFINFKYF